MYRSGGGVKLEGGKGGAMGRNGYRREYRPQTESRGGAFGDKGSHSQSNTNDNIGYGGYGDSENNPPAVAVAGLEKRLSVVQQEFAQALHKVSEKENEKFDLIFSILSELQSRQAELEESVRALKAQYSNNSPSNSVPAGQSGGCCGSQQPAQQPQQQSLQPPQQQNSFGGCSSATQPFAQMTGPMHGQMGGQMMGGMGNQTGMQSFAGQQAMFTAMPQMVVVSSPGAGMPYGMPQLMSPAGPMQPMAPQMAMQFMSPSPAQDGCGGYAACASGGGSGHDVPCASPSDPVRQQPDQSAQQKGCGSIGDSTGGVIGQNSTGAPDASAASAEAVAAADVAAGGSSEAHSAEGGGEALPRKDGLDPELDGEEAASL